MDPNQPCKIFMGHKRLLSIIVSKAISPVMCDSFQIPFSISVKKLGIGLYMETNLTWNTQTCKKYFLK